MKIRIHHFYDMIRDFGSNKNIVPHSYLHAYHTVAEKIRENSNIQLELVINSDDVCLNCTHLIQNKCDDIITHRTDFAGKEDFNNHLDNRIMEVCGLQTNKIYSPKTLCEMVHKYIENIAFIYEGNDRKHTLQRKQNVILGLKYYSEKHGFSLKLTS